MQQIKVYDSNWCLVGRRVQNSLQQGLHPDCAADALTEIAVPVGAQSANSPSARTALNCAAHALTETSVPGGV